MIFRRLLLFCWLMCSTSGAMGFAMRIVSLSPSLTKNICYLGDKAELVGCTSYCQTSGSVPVVASAVKVNVEKVIATKPDLVVTTTMTPPETVAALKKVGICVEVYPMPKSYAQICSQFRELGKRIGKEAVALRLLSDTQIRVDRLKNTHHKSRRVFIQLGANPLFAVIPGTFMNDYITFLGLTNITQGMTSGAMSREAVLVRDPEMLFIVTMGIVGEEEKKNWERYKMLSASRNKKIFIIDSDKACNPTPITFVETLEQMHHYLY
jgi:ABC-type Fe3+-hydroxamate transport system substrate-binding protein